MRKVLLALTAAAGATVVPAVMFLGLFGMAGGALACTPTSAVAADGVTSASTPSATPAPVTVTDPACDTGAVRAGTVVVPSGTSADVATAIRTALSHVGQRSGWRRLCDRLACRAYGYANSGFKSARAHWEAMVAIKYAHPADRCPPAGSFVFWTAATPAGHVAVVVENDGSCDPDLIKLVSNDVLDTSTGNYGGVYLVTLRQIESGFVRPSGYLGWSEPICIGALLPATHNYLS